MRTKLLLLLFVCAGTATLSAQIPDRAKLDSYMQALADNNKFMGTVSVSKDGKTVYTKSVGYLDAEKKTPVNENTKFRIGSISKTFTAALVFKAIDEKKLVLDTKLDKFYPAVPNAAKITIGHLLGHRSGIHNFTDDFSYQTWYTSPKSEVEMLEIITKGGSDFEPGSKADYSNSNYVLLSYILERTYKQPFKELVNQKIIKPLGLKNTYYGGAINTANNEANSYVFEGAWSKDKETDMSVPMGAGAMVSTTADLSRFLEALFAGKVVTAASLEQMKTMTDGYGMGLFQFPFNDKKAYGHTGGIDGFTSMAAYFPEDKVTFAFTSNGANYDSNNIGIAALSWIFNQPFEVPDFTSHTYKTEELDQYLGVYSSAQMPLKITITKNNTTLIAQATGQSSFPLDAASLNNFTFERAGIEMEFKPEAKQMVLKQGGAVYTFTKQ
jgi:CubicO group peptidase (beta-lactamase class C family)